MGENVGKILGKPRDAKVFAPDDRWVLPKSLIGMEFEYEGVRDPNGFYLDGGVLPHYWELHEDDSLKDMGREFVFRTPMFGADAYNAIELLMAKAKQAGFKCTLRAGIHVHLDVRDMDTAQLIGLIILYTILEPLLFRWIGDNRENSIFCIPFYKADDSLQQVVSLVKAVTSDEKNNTKNTYSVAKQFARYAALNLNALYKFGSVEFRHMKTTHDFPRVINWINIIQSLKAATFKFPTSDGAILSIAQNSAPNAFLVEIFGRTLATELWQGDAGELIQTVGIPTARDLVLHGLSDYDWRELEIPVGEHKGFNKYSEEASKKLKEAPAAPEAMDPFERILARDRERLRMEEAMNRAARAIRRQAAAAQYVEAVAGAVNEPVRPGAIANYYVNDAGERVPADPALMQAAGWNFPPPQVQGEVVFEQLAPAVANWNPDPNW